MLLGNVEEIRAVFRICCLSEEKIVVILII